MNKRKIGIILASIILLILFLLMCVKCTRNENTTISNSSDYYTETLNSMIFNTKTPITESKKKIIEVGAFQKAEITVDKIIESGDIEVELFDIENNKLSAIYLENNPNKQIFEINGGVGKYSIHVDAKNYIGQCNITLNIEEYDNTELFTSTMGYELYYDPNKFSVKYENNTEKFIYSENEDIYLKIYIVSENDVEQEKKSLLEQASQSGVCQITNNTLVGEYTSKNFKDNDDKNMIKRNLMFELEEKNMLVLEICEYENTEKVLLANEHIKNMINTFKYE